MRFDSNGAWREAMALVSANREMLFAVAGVFFLLPGLVSIVFFADFQAELLANLGNPAASERMMAGMSGPMIAFGLASFLVQAMGYLAMLSLLTDRTRPTVGQALGQAARALPTVLGAALLFFAGYMGVVLVAVMLAAVLGKLGAAGAAMAFALVVALIVGMVYVMVKLSLVLPVIVIERVTNPAAALARAWRLTKGNSLRLFFFYLLLGVVYFVILMVVTMVTMAIAIAIFGQGKAAMLVGGLLSGIVGAVASVILAAVLAAAHRQLAGPSPESLGSTFD